MTTLFPFKMSDRELLDATVLAAREERRATAELLALLAEVDARRLYLGEGCSSLFSYCTRVLYLSEHAAYHRIEAARAARRFPVILGLVSSGEVTMTTVAMLRSHLTPDNCDALLSAARHKSKREVEHQIACLAPKAAAKTLIRRLPEPNPATGTNPLPMGAELASAEMPSAERTHSEPAMPVPERAALATAAPRARVAPLAPNSYLLRVTLGADAHAKLRRARDLMRHTIPDGDVAEIVSRALTLLVAHLEKTRIAEVSRPRTASKPPATRNRHIPASVRREVWARDGGRCAFIGSHGRCSATGRLEFHHLIPFAQGGAATVVNISLRCQAHNRYESESVFGPWLPPDPVPAARSGPS